MTAAKSLLKPYLFPLLNWFYKVRNVRKGSVYGLSRPVWWPVRLWPARRWAMGLAWGFGPEHPFNGKRVEMKVGGHTYAFLSATYHRYRGHRCDGHIPATLEIIAAHLTTWGYPAMDGPILAAVSALEGGFDSIQTYDRAKFSWGFIQFAGIGGLVAVLQQLKTDAPAQFETYFARYGIDVGNGLLRVGKASGAAALNRLHDDPRLWRRFLLAGADPAVQRVQVKAAYERYFLHMLAHTERTGTTTLSYGELFAHHSYGRTILYDRAVHCGVAYTARLFKQALRQSRASGPLDADAVIQAARQLEPAAQHARWDILRKTVEGFQEPGVLDATLYD
jgi:hypothetical protein